MFLNLTQDNSLYVIINNIRFAPFLLNNYRYLIISNFFLYASTRLYGVTLCVVCRQCMNHTKPAVRKLSALGLGYKN